MGTGDGVAGPNAVPYLPFLTPYGGPSSSLVLWSFLFSF